MYEFKAKFLPAMAILVSVIQVGVLSSAEVVRKYGSDSAKIGQKRSAALISSSSATSATAGLAPDAPSVAMAQAIGEFERLENFFLAGGPDYRTTITMYHFPERSFGTLGHATGADRHETVVKSVLFPHAIIWDYEQGDRVFHRLVQNEGGRSVVWHLDSAHARCGDECCNELRIAGFVMAVTRYVAHQTGPALE